MATSNFPTYQDKISFGNRFARYLWIIACLPIRLLPAPLVFKPFAICLRLFGAKIGGGSKIYPSVSIHCPWKLTVGRYSCIGPRTIIYNISSVSIGSNVTISQDSFLCTGSHDIRYLDKPLTSKPITIDDHAWICACAFVGPGVHIAEGSVLAARSVLFRSIEKWSVYSGNPADFFKKRIILGHLEKS